MSRLLQRPTLPNLFPGQVQDKWVHTGTYVGKNRKRYNTDLETYRGSFFFF